MAEQRGLIRRLVLIFDRLSGKKAVKETQDAIKTATDTKPAAKNLTKLGGLFKTLGVVAVAAFGFKALQSLKKFAKESVRAANLLDDAERRLSATSKITGVNLGFLQLEVEKAKESFNLSTTAASDLVIEVSKLGAKAGDIRSTTEALGAFLDLGAARGLNAQQTLTAIRQSILGIDEGTDKLFNKNPSVIYAEFAKQIGKTAGALSDQEKAQALLNATLTDGGKVQGEYQRWLNTVAGQQFLLSQEVTKTKEAFGKALQPALVAILPWVTKVVAGLTDIINKLRGVQDEIDAMQRIRNEESGLPLEELQRRQIEAVGRQIAAANELAIAQRELERLRRETEGKFFSTQFPLIPGAERAVKAAQERVDLLNAEVEARKQLIGAQLPFLEGAGEDAAAAAGATEDALQKEIDLLKRAHDLRVITADEMMRAAEIEDMLATRLAGGNLTLEQRVDLQSKLNDIQAVTNTGPGDELERQIGLLERMFDLHILSGAQIDRAFEIEQQIRDAIAAGNLELEERVELQERLVAIQRITIALREAGQTGGPLAPVPRPGAIPTVTEVSGVAGGVDLDEFQESLLELESQARASFHAVEAGAFGAAFGISNAFRRAFSQLGQDIQNLGQFASTILGGVAAAGLQGIAQYASAKVAENIAQGFDLLAKASAYTAIGLAGGFFGLAPGAFAAAAVAKQAATASFLAAGKWALLGGVAGGAAGAIGGGGGGGRLGGGGRRDRDLGSERGAREEPQQDVHIHLVGDFDALNPRVQRIIYNATNNARERFGDDANVVIHHKK